MSHDRRRLDWNWGVPDWRDKDAYPKPKDLTLREWHWEFERRRPEYREAWLLNAGLSPGTLLDQSHEPHIYIVRTNPADRKQDGAGAIRDPSAPSTPFHFALTQPFFGHVLHYSDEAKDLLPSRLPPNASQQQKLIEGLGTGRIAITFDLRKPLRPQLKAAELAFDGARSGFLSEFYNAEIEKDRRKQIELWPTYLRVIDARDAGATWREIYEDILLPDPEETSEAEWDSSQSEYAEPTARKKWEQATDLMNNFPSWWAAEEGAEMLRGRDPSISA